MAKRHGLLISFLLTALMCLQIVHAQNLLERLGALTGGDRLGPQNLGQSGPEFLDPEQAFVFSHEIRSSGVVEFSWQIAENYYLYRDRFEIGVDDPKSPADAQFAAKVGDLIFEAGEIKDDPEFGRVEVYKHQTSVVAPIQVSTGPGASNILTFNVTYQGCLEDAICYPPIRKKVVFDRQDLLSTKGALNGSEPLAEIPVVAPSQSPTGTSSSIVSADRIASQLQQQGLISILALFFGFGLLLAFTPCVFPMVPILSGIIVGQKQPLSTARAFRLSLIYVLAMAATYALVGVLAGLFGHNLQASFQHPASIIIFSTVFVALALSMFGFYEMRLPSTIQNRLDNLSRHQQGGSYSGVAVMGVISAIVVGPCVAPPLAGALLYISHQGSALVGGLALFFLALGMGAPLVVVGSSAGKLLPKSGQWMEQVKKFFGVLLLGLAIWFLERILPGPMTLLLWAALFIISAVYLGALDALGGQSASWRHFRKGLGLIALAWGAVLLVGVSVGASDPFRPLSPLLNTAAVQTKHLDFIAVKGSQGLDQAIADARASGRIAMLDLYADWCIECKHLEKQTFTDEQVQASLSKMVLLRADVTDNDPQDQQLLKRFELFGPPALLFFGKDGEELRRSRVIGFLGPQEFNQHLLTIYR